MNELKNDKNLRQAVSRREQKLPPMPDDLNERLMQRLEEPETAPVAKQRPLWLYAAIAVAASILLLIIFNFGQEQTPQGSESSAISVVAQNVEQASLQPTPAAPEFVEGTVAKADVQPARKPAKKQRKVVMKLVELIPTSETASANVKTLPASVIDKVKAYDKASDPWRTTGIDDTAPLEARTIGIDDTDPLVTMTAQVEDIRQRGQRLQKEIDNAQFTMHN